MKSKATGHNVTISQPRKYVMCAGCMPFVPIIGQTVRADNMITFSTKTDKDDPTINRSKSQRAQVHEIQLVKLAKAIPSMIQTTIKKIMQLGKDKLTSLCSTVEVLEREVISLRREVAALDEPPTTNNSNPSEPAVVPMHLEAPRGPSDDWWAGYDSTSKIVSDEEL
ncbi:hypothetical protein HAX54_033233 [Datura stramonium]|uniref:Uncharacterized protein n=1 Tax=Datura stramonium TaxID=4076 RepID=A0ABS8SDE0_DATST|nr:hypothetical protein [Datura stramonium]